MMFQMREILQPHDNSDERPIGRFLIGLEQYSGQHDPYEFAREFAGNSDNFQRYKHNSREVPDIKYLEVDGRRVFLEFCVERYAYVWRIAVAAERLDHAEAIRKNQHPHGGERYELHCATPASRGKYYERGSQGSVIREKEFETKAELNKLQGLVEALLNKVDEHPGTVDEHLLVGLAQSADNLATHGEEPPVYTHGNFEGEIIIFSHHRNR